MFRFDIGDRVRELHRPRGGREGLVICVSDDGARIGIYLDDASFAKEYSIGWGLVHRATAETRELAEAQLVVAHIRDAFGC